MSRPDLSPPPVTAGVAEKMQSFHADVVSEVRDAVGQHDVVVVGMGWNPHCKRARKALDEAQISHHYLEYGNYSSKWPARLALKIWSGWPTFPQVFVKGTLIGGADQAQAAIADGSLKEMLSAGEEG